MTSIAPRRARLLLLLIGAAAALFLMGLGRLPLFGRDEALYAEAGREMLAGGDWITPRVNGAPFFEKPPLYYWLAAISYRALGASPFAARLPAALMAILTVLLTARIGARAWGPRAGLLAGLALATSLQMAMVGRMGIMDVPLTCLTVLALLAYERWHTGTGLMGGVALGVCVSMAILLKGAAGLIPLGIMGADLAVGVARKARLGRSMALSCGTALLAAAVALVLAAPWFLTMNARHGQAFGSTLFLHEHLKRMLQPMQGHGGPVWSYFPLILFGFFPWVMFVPAGTRSRDSQSHQAHFWRQLSMVWIAAVLVPFSLVSTKLPGYITPLFPALALLAGVGLDRRLRAPGRGPWIAVVVGAPVFAGLVALLPLAAARVGAQVGATQEARRLALPATLWAAGYLVIALGAAAALAGRARQGLGVITAGQVLTLIALLAGILPVLSPFLGGGSAQLALIADQELPESQIVLYETHPETVNFVLRRSVPTCGRRERQWLLARLREEPVALLAPWRERASWRDLPARRTWRAGGQVLLELPKLGPPAAGPSVGAKAERAD